MKTNLLDYLNSRTKTELIEIAKDFAADTDASSFYQTDDDYLALAIEIIGDLEEAGENSQYYRAMEEAITNIDITVDQKARLITIKSRHGAHRYDNIDKETALRHYLKNYCDRAAYQTFGFRVNETYIADKF